MKWEYIIIIIQNDIFEIETLNELGQIGWELTAVDNGNVYLKREVADMPDGREIIKDIDEDIVNRVQNAYIKALPDYTRPFEIDEKGQPWIK